MPENLRICIVGLGYVGLPLAVGLSRRYEVVGFDLNETRIRELASGHDRNREIASEELRAARLSFTARPDALGGCDLYIITVPTPVDDSNRPDLHAVRAACQTVGAVMSAGAIVVLESTVYPGVTEELCGPALEAASGLTCGHDFHLGYSPERINPGDREHTVDRITKVVAGQTPETARRLAEVYGSLNDGKIFVAKDIRTAEAAKVIENAQRDINIAFINEVTMIFGRAGLSIFDVLDAARTKWNFLPFTPGLVGGHCIGVDPFYLADFAERLQHDPEVILAGRRINDRMGAYVAECLVELLGKRGKATNARILVLGLSFKENVPDLRNSKVIDIVRHLEGRGHHVDVHDPIVDPQEAREEFGVSLVKLETPGDYDCVIGAVPHRAFATMTAAVLAELLVEGGIAADIKGMWRLLDLPGHVVRWQL